LTFIKTGIKIWNIGEFRGDRNSFLPNTMGWDTDFYRLEMFPQQAVKITAAFPAKMTGVFPIYCQYVRVERIGSRRDNLTGFSADSITI